MIENARTKVLWLMIVLTIVFAVLTVVHSIWWLIGVGDHRRARARSGSTTTSQPKHSILRNYPIVGRMRFLLEDAGPELHQYLVENNTDGRPFDRDTRSLIYERAKNVGRQEAVRHRARRVRRRLHVDDALDRAAPDAGRSRWPTCGSTVGGPQCTQPYSLSVLNISAMSFGALGEAAVRAMNTGRQDGRLRPRHRRGRAVEATTASPAAT